MTMQQKVVPLLFLACMCIYVHKHMYMALAHK